MSKKATAKSSRPSAELATLALEVVTSRDQGKAAYQRADAALVKLVSRLGPGAEIPIADGATVTLIDNFAKGNKAWKPCGINRYDIKVTYAKSAASRPKAVA